MILAALYALTGRLFMEELIVTSCFAQTPEHFGSSVSEIKSTKPVSG